jgi:hypothetical protein
MQECAFTHVKWLLKLVHFAQIKMLPKEGTHSGEDEMTIDERRKYLKKADQFDSSMEVLQGEFRAFQRGQCGVIVFDDGPQVVMPGEGGDALHIQYTLAYLGH